MIIHHPNKTHEAALTAAELARQNGIAAANAAGGGSDVVAAAVKAVEVTYYRALIASCTTHGLPSSGFRQGLHSLIGMYS